MELDEIIKGLDNLISESKRVKALSIIQKAFDNGEIDGDILEKAKYIRRTGTKGNYKYIYAEGSGRNGKKEINKKNGKFFKEVKGLKLNQLVPISEDADYEGQDMSWTETFTGVEKIGKGGEWATHGSDSIIKEFLDKRICLSPQDHSISVFGDHEESNLKLEKFITENKIEVNREGWKRYVYAIFLPEGTEVDTYSGDEYRIDLNDNFKIQYVGYKQDVFLGVNNVKTLHYTVKPKLKK